MVAALRSTSLDACRSWQASGAHSNLLESQLHQLTGYKDHCLGGSQLLTSLGTAASGL